MTNEQIKQTLHDIAQQAIPDSTDIWADIQADLPRQQTTRHKPVHALVRVVVAIAIFLTLGMVSYAVYQNLNRSDPGLEAVHEAGLVTELGLSWTIDDVTVTLDWAYADVNRVVINYTVESPIQVAVQEQYLEVTTSHSSAGHPYWIYPHMPPPSIDVGSDSYITADRITLDTTRLMDLPVEELPDQLNFYLKITLAELATPSDDGVVENPDLATLPESATIGIFPFRFSLPVIQATIITPTQHTVEANGMSITLKEVRLTPSMTRAIFCYPLPHQNEGWMPSVTLSISELNSSISGNRAWVSWDSDTPSRRLCTEMSFPVPYTEQPSTLIFTVDEMALYPGFIQDRTLELRERLARQGIETETMTTYFAEGLEFRILTTVSAPDDIDVNAVVAEASTELTERVAGPWVFGIEVP